MAEQREDTGVQENFSFPQMEENILQMWREKDVFHQSLEKTKKGKPYIFYDGPPFATGLPHHGHLVASTLKDIMPRYFTMKGYYVDRRFGWDCHGLPIEQEIDKKLGMNAHEAVEKLGIAAYNQECRAIVQRYTAQWEKTIARLGRWVDFENDYKTMDLNFMESVWWVFKEIWDKGLIYQGKKIVPFSTAFGTVLSNFEATSNYQDVQDPALTVLFKLKKPVLGHDVHLAAWTTTPWTLPSNLGLCVHPEFTYVIVQEEGREQKVLLAKELLPQFSKKKNLNLVGEVLGSELEGMVYQPLFPYFQEYQNQGGFRVFNDTYVTAESGTGVVHMAPSFGEDDYRIMAREGVAFDVDTLDHSGCFLPLVQDFSGQYVKDADKHIIKFLKNQNLVWEQGVIVHSYPFCPRTDTPLIYRAIPSWYLAVEKIKKELQASNEEINWVPHHIKSGRFGKWIEGARDWAISRNRIWGTPIPVWINDQTGKELCIGSVAQLEELSGKKIEDLHREFVDPLAFSLPGEEGVYRRIPEVFDCWFESGSMPYAQLHYPFANQEVFKAGFPAEFIAEGLDQTRGWFYTLNVLSTALYQKPAFKNVIVNGMVLAADGKKMSKRLKNYTAPDILMEKFGADALRLFLINSGLVKAEELKFTDHGVRDVVRLALLPLYNAFKFFHTYAQVDGWVLEPQDLTQQKNNILDRWILAKLQTTLNKVDGEMQSYKLYNVLPVIIEFIDDLTNWYIRLNRRRFWDGEMSVDKKEAYTTLYQVLRDTAHMMAPLTPFLAEYLYQELRSYGELPEDSVHLRSFPTATAAYRDDDLEDAVKKMQEVILLGRQKRNQEKIKVKMPLSSLTVIHSEEKILQNLKPLAEYIKNELNLKTVLYETNEDQYIKLFARPNSPKIGKRLGKDFGKVRGALTQLSLQELKAYEQGEPLECAGYLFQDDDLFIYREALEGSAALSNAYITINLDTTMTPELIREGLAREVINRIQKTRKEASFEVSDRIIISYDSSEVLKESIDSFLDYIKRETLCTEMVFTPHLKTTHEFNIEQEWLHLVVEKV